MRIVENGKIIKGKDDRKYIKVSNSQWMSYNVYVAKQNPDICGEWFDGCEVHHKDGNRENDDPNNLICLTKEEHHKIHREISKVTGIGVNAYKNGKLIGEFPTIAKCSEAIGIPTLYISRYLKGKHIPVGKYDLTGWSFTQTTDDRRRRY